MAIFTESFEGLGPTENSPYWNNAHAFFLPGHVEPFIFNSTLQYLHPVPNSGVTFVGDFAGGGAYYPLGKNGVVEKEVVPEGTAYFALSPHGAKEATFKFFPNVYSVSACVTAGGPEIGLAAYTADGKLITGASIKSVEVDDWRNNIITIRSDKPIKSVIFEGDSVVIDVVSFSTDSPRTIYGTAKADLIDADHTVAAQLFPGATDDLIYGKGGADRLSALGGGDTIHGGAGRDAIHGNGGDDALNGGGGSDHLVGGDGQDSFLFDRADGHSIDRLSDFDPGEDTIVLSQAVFDELSSGYQTEAFSKHLGGHLPVSLIYQAGTGKLFYDDGEGSVVFARVAKHLKISGDDFLVA
jgi:Ca2+-binding RTX toxin-like protein